MASNQKPALGVGLREQLGEILVRKGRLDRHELAQALAESKAAELRLGEYLVRTGLVYENEVAQALADQFELPYSALERSMIDRETAQLMRADPDAILVGEIRDLETAEITMQAAMTGHLVLSSVHASSAPAALTRLRELGLGAALVASAVTCVVAQRLVRRPCATYGEGTRILDAEVVAAGLPAGTVLHRPRGCAACGHTGCSGRVAVFESLLLDDEIRAAADRGSSVQIEAAARKAGMRSLRGNALVLCLAGQTTLDEVERVCGGVPAVGPSAWAEAA